MHPFGDDEIVVLVCCPSDEHAPQSEYDHDVQVGGVQEQDCVKIGLPPTQFKGEDVTRDLVCCPFCEHTLQLEYVQDVQVGEV